ncbi:MAG: hypothetical protein Pyrs2KO_24390 [Pyruvatibacter sp.]
MCGENRSAGLKEQCMAPLIRAASPAWLASKVAVLRGHLRFVRSLTVCHAALHGSGGGKT